MDLSENIFKPNSVSRENSFDKGGEEHGNNEQNKGKKMQLSLDQDTIFDYSCTVEDDKLYIKLSEISSYAPFIYESYLSKEDFIRIHRMFKSCDNVKDIKRHLDNLFKKNNIQLIKESEDSITFVIKANHIADEVKIKINSKMSMIKEKDEALLKLYKIQKDEIKILKEINNYINSSELKGNNITQKIKDILKNKL